MRFYTIFIAVIILSSISYACSEGETRACGESNQGVCSFGTQSCTNGAWGICLGAINPSEEVCNDNLDNDCDGKTDENCLCKDGEVKKCGLSEVGVCEFGVQTCKDNQFGQCFGAINPINETCNDKLDNDCDGLVDEDCSTVSCFDNIKNQDEEGIDCGGSCQSCFSCSDGIQNQNETGVDCGGPCNPCVSCKDRIRNGDEEGIDCGGSCPNKCVNEEELDKDLDGLSLKEEIEKGTDPNSADSDFDGINDKEDNFPLCGNNFCDVNFNENEKNCKKDCKKESGFPFVYLIILFIIILSGFAYYIFFYKNKPKEIKLEEPKKTVKIMEPKTKERETKTEKQLQESLKEVEKYFK